MKTGYSRIRISLLFFLCITGLIYATIHSPLSEKGKQLHNPCRTLLPQPNGYTNDFVNLFTQEEKLELDSIIRNHEKETGNQIAIITIDSAMLGKCNVDEYTLAVGKEWGVGQKEKNNGIVIGIAPYLRKISIRNGYGIESRMTNEETQIIIDSTMVPFFKNAQYFEGVKSGLFAIFDQIK